MYELYIIIHRIILFGGLRVFCFFLRTRPSIIHWLAGFEHRTERAQLRRENPDSHPMDALEYISLNWLRFGVFTLHYRPMSVPDVIWSK